METTQGTLLGGRIRYSQPASGFRTGIEPVLLAAAIPARPGERVLEGGSGAGAALLCLAARVAGVGGIGIERDPALAALGEANARANTLAIRFVAADVLAMPAQGGFDHAFANPPYHHASGSASPDRAQTAAKQGAEGLVADWAAALIAALRPGGTLTLILPPARLGEALTGCDRVGSGGIRLLPLWPRTGQPAKLMLIRAVRGGRSAAVLLAGMVLHRADGAFTAEAEACLRDGAALAL